MVFHEIGNPVGPTVLLLGPEMAGWWAMAPLSKRLTADYLCVLAGHDGYGEAYTRPFTSVEAEGREVASWVGEHVAGGRLRAIIGVGLGGQVAVEALCEDSGVAECAVLGDVLCVESPGSKGSAWMNGAFWRFIAKRPRYAKSQLDAYGIPHAMLDVFVRDAQATPKETVRAQTLAVENWRPPEDIRAITCPVRVTCAGLQSGPRRESGETLARAIPGATLDVERDLHRNELYLQYPDRAAEFLLPWLERRGRA